MKDKQKRSTFELDEDVFYKFKCYCAEHRVKVKEVLTQYIEEITK